MTAYEAGKLWVQMDYGNIWERSRAAKEGRDEVPRDPALYADKQAALDAWYASDEGTEYRRTLAEIVALEDRLLDNTATEAGIEEHRSLKASGPFADFERGLEDESMVQAQQFVDWLCAKGWASRRLDSPVGGSLAIGIVARPPKRRNPGIPVPGLRAGGIVP